MATNFNSLTVDSSGHTSFSGLSSGIDFQSAIDSIIQAKRVPVDRLEAQISTNNDKITALQDLKTLLGTLQTSFANLYGQVSLGNANDVFENKQAFASTSRVDGGTASAADNLIGATISNAAATGTHNIEILQTAKAHKISSDQVTSLTTALGFTTGDSFTINGQVISLSATDTLQDLRDRLNNADTGSNPTGVSASIVSVSDTEHYLLLTADQTGQAISISDTSGTPLQTVGILDGVGGIKNELQAAQTAKFYADGLLDQTNTIYESSFQTSAGVTVGSNGTLTFTRDSDGTSLGTVAYTSGDTLQTLADAISANVTNVTATVVTDGAGLRLEISGTDGFSISESGGGTAIGDLGINNKRRVIERTSNTIDDLFAGVTLNLFQAEKGTTVSLQVEHDLSKVKTQILAFVDAYNALREVINKHRQTNKNTGAPDDQTGVLFSSQALAAVTSTLSSIIGHGADGVSIDFQVLSQIGVNFVDINQPDPLKAETLQVDEAKLDKALLNNPDDVRRLFTFEFTPGDPRVSLLGFNGDTTYDGAGYTLNIQPASGDNLLQFSEQADNAYWTANNATISADATMAPDGNTTADGLIADAVATTHSISNAAPETVTGGSNYIFSTYVKAGNKDQTRIAFNGAGFGGASIGADFDLTNGTVISSDAGITNTSIQNVGNGWFRIGIEATATATGDAYVERYARDNALGTTFTGDGATVNNYFFGSQLQEVTTETAPGDYIPTTNAARVGVVASANINGPADGSDDGSATLDGNTLTVNSGGAKGLTLFTSGFDFTSSTQLNYTVGVGSQMFFALDKLLDKATGPVENEIKQLTDQNSLNQDRIDEMLARLDAERQNLTDRFIHMETTIASANRVLASIKSITDALFAPKKN